MLTKNLISKNTNERYRSWNKSSLVWWLKQITVLILLYPSISQIGIDKNVNVLKLLY